MTTGGWPGARRRPREAAPMRRRGAGPGAAAPVIDPAVREYRPDTVPMAVGTRTLVRLRLWGLPLRAPSVVTAWEPGRHMAMASERPSRPVRVLATHEFAARPGDRCRYTWSVTVQARGRVGRVA